MVNERAVLIMYGRERMDNGKGKEWVKRLEKQSLFFKQLKVFTPAANF